MIVRTKYRDIPWEEARRCIPEEMLAIYVGSYWESRRGKPVEICVPAITEHQWKYAKCGGPFFDIAGKNKGRLMVCPHIAEIGD